ARDEALEALAVSAQGVDPQAKREADGALLRGEGPASREVRIAFPDGLSVSLAHALKRLREPPGPRPGVEPEPGRGPSGSLALAWAFDCDPGRSILAVSRLREGAILVLDDHGALHCVETGGGRLEWRRSGAEVFGGSYRPTNIVARHPAVAALGNLRFSGRNTGATAAPGAAGVLEPSRLRLAPRLVVDALTARIFVSAGRTVRCLSGDDGRLLWSSLSVDEAPGFPGGDAASVPPEMVIFADAGRVYGFEPRNGVVFALDGASGKLIWRRDVYREAGPAVPATLFGLNTGASYHRGKMLVYGRRAAVIDCREGELTWAFDGGGVRTFPLTLRIARPGEGMSGISPAAAGGGGRYTTWIDHLARGSQRQPQLARFLKYRGALVAPALAWVEEQSRRMLPSRGVLAGGRMFLLGGAQSRLLSLDLPLAASFFEAGGTFAGFAGEVACFVQGSRLGFFHPGARRVTGFDIPDLPEGAEVEIAISGPRVYASSSAGVHCINAYTGRLLFAAPWPEELRDAQRARRTSNPLPIEYYWDGIAGGTTRKAGYCTSMRNLVEGDSLCAIVSSGRLVALRSAKPGLSR
ncbi:MAG: PQQ-binding-like beta-propeller repeat protein, partial [Verrucomicrobiales bacterium]